jgi:hypothetical protein
MTDGKNCSLPISEIHSEDGAQELVRSERMKPYLALTWIMHEELEREPDLC